MRRFIPLIFVLLCGCATVVHGPQPGVRSQSRSVVTPPPVVHVWFMAGTNWPESDDWTNYYAFTALTSADLTAPLDQWQASAPELERYQGHLGFALDASQPQLFCRALFQDKGL